MVKIDMLYFSLDDISNFVNNQINTPYWLVRKVSNYIHLMPKSF